MSDLTPLASWAFVLIVVGLPTLALGCVLRVASLASRAEEELFSEELTRRSPSIRPTPKTRPYIRETHTLDYSKMTSADIARAFNTEAEVRPN